jgi:serine/arginine repetitive matrix protein 1
MEVEKKANNAMEPASKHMLPKGSSGHAEDEKETDMRNGARGKKRLGVLFYLFKFLLKEQGMNYFSGLSW